jgi:hypothetical protein
MKNSRNSRTVLTLVSLVLTTASLTGCAVKQQAAAEGTPEKELVLAYRIPDDRALTYRMSIVQTRNLEVMGRSQQSGSDKKLEVSMKSGGSGADDQQLTITVDSMFVQLDTPRGVVKREPNEVLGKSFGMTISSRGEESEISGARELSYDMYQARKLNVTTSFVAFFPNLPEGPVRIGDSWPTTEHLPDTIFESAQAINMQSVHTIEGTETIDGMDCLKIRTGMNGKLEPIGERMTRTPVMEAELEGNGVWYFAHEEGLLVKASVTIRGVGEMKSDESGGRPMPMNQEMTIETRLQP